MIMAPKIRIPGAPDFAPHFEKLLARGRIKSTSETRSDLNAELGLAWAYKTQERKLQSRAAPEDIKQLKDSITRTKNLLRQLGKFGHTRDIECHLCPVGEGTVSIASVRQTIFEEELELPRNPPPLGGLPEQIPHDGTMALINIHRLLDRLQREIDYTQRKRKRGRQIRRDYQSVIAHAARFFRRHSSVDATSYSKGTFSKFCKLFYEVVNGSPLPSDHALYAGIKAEWGKPAFGSKSRFRKS
jgi:hypothetical protein